MGYNIYLLSLAGKRYHILSISFFKMGYHIYINIYINISTSPKYPWYIFIFLIMMQWFLVFKQFYCHIMLKYCSLVPIFTFVNDSHNIWIRWQSRSPAIIHFFYCCVRYWYGYDFWSKWDIISYLISENCKGYYIISNIPILDIISDMIWKRYKKIDIFTTTDQYQYLRNRLSNTNTNTNTTQKPNTNYP